MHTNPVCKHCGGEQKKNGHYDDGRQIYRCLALCQGVQRRKSRSLVTPDRCPYCDGRTIMHGRQCGRQRYRCIRCGSVCIGDFHVKPEPLSREIGECRKARCIKPRKSIAPVAVSPELRQARQLEALMIGAALSTMVNAVVPSYLSADVKDDLRQEMTLAALEGDFDLSDLARMVPYYQRRIYRLSANRFKFVSLSSVIPGTTNLTYADTLVG